MRINNPVHQQCLRTVCLTQKLVTNLTYRHNKKETKLEALSAYQLNIRQIVTVISAIIPALGSPCWYPSLEGAMSAIQTTTYEFTSL